jgi:dolichol-phosphate mannosyltransferase
LATNNDDTKILISVVLPCFNEEGNIRPYYDEFVASVDLINYRYEIIFVDDGSSDLTWLKIQSLPNDKIDIIGIKLLFNCGHAVALQAGLERSRGAAVLMMDADLQHPIKYINLMIGYWINGYQLVSCIRMKTDKIGFLKNFSSKIFYKILNRISDLSLKDGESDFRLVDGVLMSLINSYPESPKFYRGIFNKFKKTMK